MKVCQINCVYGVGSTGKITRDIHHTLIESGIESVVIAPVKSPFSSEHGVYYTSNKFLSYASAILRRLFGMTFDWAQIQTKRLIKILKKEEPDVVHLQCINGNDINVYMLLDYLSKNNIKTLYTLHAEFPYTGGCGNTMACEKWRTGCGKCPNLKGGTQSPIIDGTHRTWKKQKSSYKRFNPENLQFTAVSPWLKQRSEEAEIIKSFKKTTVMNGVDVSVFNYYSKEIDWRQRLGIKAEEKLLLNVTASFFPHEENLKGGHFIIELARQLKETNIKIVVAANIGDGTNLPTNVIYVGRTNNQQELAALYREANLSILTSKSETFGMPVAESLCCGTPVVGFKAGGPESITIDKYSEFVDYGNIEVMSQAILKWVYMPLDKEAIAREAQLTYSKEIMTDNYIKLYKHLLAE